LLADGAPGTMAISDEAGSLTVPPWGNRETTLTLSDYTATITHYYACCIRRRGCYIGGCGAGDDVGFGGE
jgi:hypothetical protein